jgi:hypothetical protein
MAGLIAPVARLIEAFNRLPGVGPKTAQRLTYHVLRSPADEARALAEALIAVKEQVAYCSTCWNITEVGVDPCVICADPQRDATRICVVEEPLDVLALERTRAFKGRYHIFGRWWYLNLIQICFPSIIPTFCNRLKPGGLTPVTKALWQLRFKQLTDFKKNWIKIRIH